jgi:hypothetical protein
MVRCNRRPRVRIPAGASAGTARAGPATGTVSTRGEATNGLVDADRWSSENYRFTDGRIPLSSLGEFPPNCDNEAECGQLRESRRTH